MRLIFTATAAALLATPVAAQTIIPVPMGAKIFMTGCLSPAQINGYDRARHFNPPGENKKYIRIISEHVSPDPAKECGTLTYVFERTMHAPRLARQASN